MKRKIIEILFTPVVFSLLATAFILWVLSFTSCTKRRTLVVNPSQLKMEEALQYAKSNKMDTTVCILVDFSQPSHVQRMSVVDLQTKSIISRGQVSHGMGTTHFSIKPRFSNIVGSHLSSLGKYRIGDRGWSTWGIHVKYLLHGLEPTNSNALKRNVVLHSWEAIPDEIDRRRPRAAAQGYGCPAVSNKYMKHLDKVLSHKKNVLLWIFK